MNLMRLILILLCLFIPLSWAAIPETDWLELMPEQDRQALENMPDIIHEGPEDPGFMEQGKLKQQEGLAPVMYSSKTVSALANKPIRLGGYPVPLQHDANGKMIEFFLVPYPGACIHVPPPPPNQIVLVRYPKGFDLTDIYTPLWVSGILKIEDIRNDMADAAYAITDAQVKEVSEDDL